MIVLKFLAAWTILDSIAIVISSALKGAGDTRFIMFAMLGISITFLILPTYIALEVFDLGLTAAWSIGLAYMISLAVAYGLRYKTGKWTSMKVIEQPPSPEVV
jgi:MATE family multidrug resistance protein